MQEHIVIANKSLFIRLLIVMRSNRNEDLHAIPCSGNQTIKVIKSKYFVHIVIGHQELLQVCVCILIFSKGVSEHVVMFSMGLNIFN